MDRNHQGCKKSLEEQLQWCKEQDDILREMNIKLHQMKRIVEYALEYELTSVEINDLNRQLNKLKRDVSFLEKQLHSVVH